MSIFKKKSNAAQIPAPFTADDVIIESSTCTGEKTIGFYDASTKKLLFAELVRSEKDIREFYEKYNISYQKK